MAVVRDVVLPLANYPNGTRTVTARVIGDDATKLKLEIQRCTSAAPSIWPNASTQLQVDLEVSYDGGSTWLAAGGFGAAGGVHVSRGGTELPITFGRFGVPAGTNRQLRATVTISGGPLRSSATLEVS